MYSGVPKIMPVRVSLRAPAVPVRRVELEVAHLRDAEVDDLDEVRRPSRSIRKMFSGLRSRWTMPLSCAAPSALAALVHDPHRALGRQRAAAREHVGEVLALEHLHHEVARAARRLAEVEDVDDVRVADARRALGLRRKRSTTSARLAEVLAQDLDRDALLDQRVLAS